MIKKTNNDLIYLAGNVDGYIECLELLNPISDFELLNNEMALFATAMEDLSIDNQQIYWTVIEAFHNKFKTIDELDQNSIIYILANIDEYIECINSLNPISDFDLLNNEMVLFVKAMRKLALDNQQLCWPVIEAFQNQFQMVDNHERAKRKIYSL